MNFVCIDADRPHDFELMILIDNLRTSKHIQPCHRGEIHGTQTLKVPMLRSIMDPHTFHRLTPEDLNMVRRINEDCLNDDNFTSLDLAAFLHRWRLPMMTSKTGSEKAVCSENRCARAENFSVESFSSNEWPTRAVREIPYLGYF